MQWVLGLPGHQGDLQEVHQMTNSLERMAAPEPLQLVPPRHQVPQELWIKVRLGLLPNLLSSQLRLGQVDSTAAEVAAAQ